MPSTAQPTPIEHVEAQREYKDTVLSDTNAHYIRTYRDVTDLRVMPPETNTPA